MIFWIRRKIRKFWILQDPKKTSLSDEMWTNKFFRAPLRKETQSALPEHALLVVLSAGNRKVGDHRGFIFWVLCLVILHSDPLDVVVGFVGTIRIVGLIDMAHSFIRSRSQFFFVFTDEHQICQSCLLLCLAPIMWKRDPHFVSFPIDFETKKCQSVICFSIYHGHVRSVFL